MRNAIYVALLLAAACSADDQRTPTATPPSKPALEHATQTDLAQDIDDAERLGTWKETQAKWQGQVVHWNVFRRAALCRSADACNVAVFPIQSGAKSGWMPKLAFLPGQFEALEAACKHGDTCEVAIDGTLDALALTADSPTNVHLTGVRIAPVKTAQR